MTRPAETVLYADADPDAAVHAARALGSGVRVRRAVDFEGAWRELEHGSIDVLVADVELPGRGGLALLASAAERWPDLPVILVASRSSGFDPVAASRAGASDFLAKPFELGELGMAVEKALSTVASAAEAPPAVAGSLMGSHIVGESEPIRDVQAQVRRAAQSTSTVLIRGETGTGKELVAQQVHALSRRAEQPFVKVHCAALPDALLESELLGYEKGAFTGASARKPGRVEIANGGTLFLDEIGDISSATQVKLLRVLQDRRRRALHRRHPP